MGRSQPVSTVDGWSAEVESFVSAAWADFGDQRRNELGEWLPARDPVEQLLEV